MSRTIHRTCQSSSIEGKLSISNITTIFKGVST
nr:MAG TPA: hypothetical protein [Caudoviricetes sp.]